MILRPVVSIPRLPSSMGPKKLFRSHRDPGRCGQRDAFQFQGRGRAQPDVKRVTALANADHRTAVHLIEEHGVGIDGERLPSRAVGVTRHQRDVMRGLGRLFPMKAIYLAVSANFFVTGTVTAKNGSVSFTVFVVLPILS